MNSLPACQGALGLLQRTAIALLAATFLTSCAELGYAVLQEPDTPHARSQCEAIHNRTLRERCHARIVPSHDKYTQQREDLAAAIRKERQETKAKRDP